MDLLLLFQKELVNIVSRATIIASTLFIKNSISYKFACIVIGPGKVNSLQVVVLNDSAVRVQWELVTPSERNGVIGSYYLNVTTYNNSLINTQMTDLLAVVVTDLGKKKLNKN